MLLYSIFFSSWLSRLCVQCVFPEVAKCDFTWHCMFYWHLSVAGQPHLKLKKFNLPQELLKQFYSAIIESVLCTSITVWFSSATKSDLIRLWKVVRTSEHWYNPPHSPRTLDHSRPLTPSTLLLWTFTIWSTLQSSEHQNDQTQKQFLHSGNPYHELLTLNIEHTTIFLFLWKKCNLFCEYKLKFSSSNICWDSHFCSPSAGFTCRTAVQVIGT